MGEISNIGWTDATVNFWWGCTKVGPGCDGCYAEAWDNRFGGTHWGQGVPRRKIKSAVALIHKLDNGYAWWGADYAAGFLDKHCGHRRRVFIQSMSDLFDLEAVIGDVRAGGRYLISSSRRCAIGRPCWRSIRLPASAVARNERPDASRVTLAWWQMAPGTMDHRSFPAAPDLRRAVRRGGIGVAA